MNKITDPSELTFTDRQIANWRKYEKVRKSGRYNMLDPQAQSATGLETDDYLFVMKHFAELRDAAEASKKSPSVQ